MKKYFELSNRVHKEMNATKHVVSKRDIYKYLECYDKQDFSPMWETALYKERGNIYCRMIELIYRLRGEI